MWIISFLIYVIFIIYLTVSARRNTLKKGKGAIVLMCFSAFVLRLIISALSHGYETDMGCFSAWAQGAAKSLPHNFYDSMWCDYPPGYLYVLWIIGAIKNVFSDMSYELFKVLLKLPACFCDILTGVFIFKFTKEKTAQYIPEGGMALYLFSPAVIVNSALWGQVDSVFLLLLLYTLCFLSKEQYFKSALLFGVCMAVKMQAVMFSPLFLYVLCEKYSKTKDKKLFITFFECVLLGIFTAVLIALPYLNPKEFFWLYKSTTGQYPYASLNAFNFFAALGKNTIKNSEAFFFLTYKAWGNIGIILSVLVSGIYYFKSRDREKLFYAAALLITLVFTFSSDMHERYLFPAMALFLISALCGGDKKTFLLFFGVTFLQYVNVGYLYGMSLGGVYHFAPESPLVICGGIFMTAIALLAVMKAFWRNYEKNNTV